MKKILVLGLFLIISSQISFAQKNKKHHRSKFSVEHKAELKAYFEETMYPVLKKAHDKMEQSLSSEELTLLYEQRTKKAALKKKVKALRQAAKTYRAEGKTKEDVRELLGDERREANQERMAIRKALLSLIDNNPDLLESIKNDLIEHHKEWRKGKDAIHEKYLDPQEAAERKAERKIHKQHLVDRIGAERAEKKIMYKKAFKFLLWDGQLPKANDKEANTALDNEGGFGAIGNKIILNNYPNPVVDVTTISFELPQKANAVSLLVTDINGKIVQDFSLGAKSSGTHTLEFNAKELSSGQYFYVLDVDGQQLTQSMIKK